MARKKKTRLTKAAAAAGAAAGRATRTAHRVAKAVKVARKELNLLTKRVEALARDVKHASKRVQRSLG